jgi:rod shape-determining protein MreD
MKTTRIFLLSLIVFLLQSTVIQEISVYDIIPNLNIIVLVLIAIYFSDKTIIIYALSSGILQDLYTSPYIGINIMLYLIISSLLIRFESVFNKTNIISPIFLIALGSSLYNILYFVVLKVLNLNFSIYRLFDILIIELSLNVIFGVVLFKATQNYLLDR